MFSKQSFLKEIKIKNNYFTSFFVNYYCSYSNLKKKKYSIIENNNNLLVELEKELNIIFILL